MACCRGDIAGAAWPSNRSLCQEAKFQLKLAAWCMCILWFFSTRGRFGRFCMDPSYGISKANEDARINCTNGMTGQKIKRCSTDGNYGEEEDFCVSNEINEILQITKNSTELAKQLPQLVGKLDNISKSQNNTTPGNLQASLNILHAFSTVSNVSLELVVVEGFLSIVDSLVDVRVESAWTSVKIENKTSSSQLLKSVEDFTRLLNPPNQTFNIIKPNIQLKGMKVEPGKDYQVDFSNRINNRSVTNSVSIHQTELAALTNGSLIMSIAFLTVNDILNPPPTSNYKLNGLVVATTAKLKSIDIAMHFMPLDSTLAPASAQCVFWNLKNGSWDKEGCKHEINGSNIICRCNHLTSFSLLMLPITDFEVPPWLLMLKNIVLGTSQVSLIIGIIIEAIVWKNLTKNNTSLARHLALLNIVLTLLIMNTLFLICYFLKPKDISCKAVIFLAHFFLLALFFWMFTLGLQILYHLVFLLRHYRRSTMMLISFILGYICPLLIVIGVFVKGLFKDHYFEKKICSINLVESDYSFCFVSLIIIGINFFITFFAIVKVRCPAIGEKFRSHQSDNNPVKQILRCIIILTPLLGLHLFFGLIFLIASTEYKYMSKEIIVTIFEIVDEFQGFFILIFGIIMDKKGFFILIWGIIMDKKRPVQLHNQIHILNEPLDIKSFEIKGECDDIVCVKKELRHFDEAR
ncbi:adhesion G-protein coupled receptor F1-like [Amblyraja radiata]|uniref:adhesion G-protein coupled receptor F1-like n=1 Tax=Amblyraja radiata TaxID=386614 RepID=UPI00140401CA|nr:adhesion G-protein coupled receptor F1-like [Amblyraja radiata]